MNTSRLQRLRKRPVGLFVILDSVDQGYSSYDGVFDLGNVTVRPMKVTNAPPNATLNNTISVSSVRRLNRNRRRIGLAGSGMLIVIHAKCGK